MNLLLSPLLRILLFSCLSLQLLFAVTFSEDEKEWLSVHPVVTFGSDFSWPPYDFVDKEGKHTGISEDFLALISQKSGLKFNIKMGVWADILKEMQEGKLDGLSCAVKTPDREKYLNFSTPYVSMPLAIVVQETRQDIQNIEDLKGKTIAVNKGSYLHEWLVKYHPEIHLKLMHSNDESLSAVSFSKVDAYIGNIAVATYIIKNHYLSNLKIVNNVEKMYTTVSIAVAKDNRILLSIINKTLSNLSSTEKKYIRDKWIPVSYKSKIDYTLVYQILALFFFFVLGTWFWYRRVSIEVKKRKESESQMSMLIDTIPLSVIVSNFSGEVLRANAFALETFNVTEEEISQYNVMSFYADSSERDSVMETIQSEGKVVDKIVKFHRSDGSEMNVMMSIMPILYDGQKARLSIMVDLTERIEMEEHLREAKQVAEHANKSKSVFLANMSHEIRTPMNAIMGFTELLHEQVETPRLKSYTNIIRNAGTTLLTLINDILDLSKIEAGKLEIHKTAVDVHTLAEEIVSMFSIIASQKGLSIILDVDKEIPPSLLLDGIRLRQVLVNLMGNAVKFTEEGYVKLSIHAFNIDVDLSKLDLEISVEDTGIGIPEDQRERIFMSFEQQEGQDNRKFGGTGLGLSISKRLVEMMDGTIMVQSEEKHGATFFLYLYAVDISVIVPEDETKKSNTDKGKIVFSPAKLLIVDDIEDNRALILNIFKHSHIDVFTASDGVEALAAYKTYKPDLILMDIRMPKMDGYEAARRIRKISDVPIIALTASVMRDEYERSQSEVFNGYLRKPILKEALLTELSHYLGYHYEGVESKENDDSELNVWDSIHEEDKETIQRYLELTVDPLYEMAKQSNNISEIQQFNVSLETLIKEYEVESLKVYVQQLTEAIDTFDIVTIQSLLNVYAQLALRFR